MIYHTNATGWYFDDGRFIPKLAPQTSGDPLIDTVLSVLPTFIILFTVLFILVISRP